MLFLEQCKFDYQNCIFCAQSQQGYQPALVVPGLVLFQVSRLLPVVFILIANHAVEAESPVDFRQFLGDLF